MNSKNNGGYKKKSVGTDTNVGNDTNIVKLTKKLNIYILQFVFFYRIYFRIYCKWQYFDRKNNSNLFRFCTELANLKQIKTRVFFEEIVKVYSLNRTVTWWAQIPVKGITYRVRLQYVLAGNDRRERNTLVTNLKTCDSERV